MTDSPATAKTTGSAAVDTGGIDPAVFQRRWIILAVLCLSLVLVVAAVSSVNVAIPSIRTQLKPSDTQLLWIVDAYAVVFAGLLLPAGAIGDKFGRKGALQAGLAIFAIASTLSSFAGSPAQLLVWRALMGIGAALIMPSTLSLLTSVFPPRERPKAIATWSGFAGAGGVVGTLAGGLVLTHFWWGSVFFVSVPISLLALVLVSVLCPSSKEAHSHPLDPLGALASVIGFGSLLYGIIEGPENGWGSATTIIAFVVAVAALTTFVVWERRASDPMLDMGFFAIPRFRAGALGVTFVFFAMFAMFFLLAQYLQSVKGWSPLRAGVATLPFAMTMIAISPRGPRMAARVGARRLVLFGLLILPVGLLILSFASRTTPYLLTVLGMVVMAAGPACAIPTLSTGIVLSLPMDKAGVGSAVNDTTREVGGAVGIAILGSILNARYRSGLKPALAQLPPTAAPVADAARHGVGALGELVRAAPGIPALAPLQAQLQGLYTLAKDEFVGGMQIGLRVAAVIALVVAVGVHRWYPSGEAMPGIVAPGPRD